MKRFNINEFIWFIILLVFTFYIYYLLSSTKITMFVHPKLAKYSAFSLVVLGELTILQIFNVFTVKTRIKFKKGYVLFILVLVIGIFIAPRGLNSEIAEKKGITFVSSSSTENIGSHTHTKDDVINGNVISFNDENYIHYFEDLSGNLEKHIGKGIIISGYVTKDDKLNKDEFIITRLLVNCCAADSQVIGILCKTDGNKVLKNDTWVRVEGVVSFKENENSKINRKLPLIIEGKVTKINKPVTPYIYE
ncbi:TIGR03943 family putative permease subunit [Candidatus Clostridium radicumherbarum]|uniref:TIGR03943 family putative permease subunit n=1 Tax=Candidatus Clostridium radicumherbarum TaxID=3381662 RepID=A0ABW8TYV0_9CLOT